ncbi:MAG: copper-binding protein [Xanthobacteraceae bacterium]|nr:copper-binding protein [Xanthobacteraceae bacterium]
MQYPLTNSIIAALVALPFAAGSVHGQQATSPSEWMNKLDREHNHLVSKEGHAHGRGQVEAVDPGGISVTILTEQMASADGTIWMPAMRMTFHVTNSAMLRDLRQGDRVEFRAARLRNAVMITDIHKAQ